MFNDETLNDYLTTTSTIRSQTKVVAEWNMNVPGNIAKVGNYRYRPTDLEDTKYNTLTASFSPDDTLARFYEGATDSDTVVDGGVTDSGVPTTFLTKKEKEAVLYSLEDCFGRFRPRSGINKLRYFPGKFVPQYDEDLASRPRYHMADRTDPFKYWTSYRTENGVERGIANKVVNNQNFIDDAVPFVVYSNPVPANRLVVKMQTHVGSINKGSFNNLNGSQIPDPFYGDENKATPVKWRVELLKDDNWVTALSFLPNSTRRDGSPIISSDGYVELSYGLVIPEQYIDIFYFAGTYPTKSALPDPASVLEGSAYHVKANELDAGEYYIATSGRYDSFAAEYRWSLYGNEENAKSQHVTDLTSPSKYFNQTVASDEYREFQYISGVRVVVETMNKFDSTFDLIEISPRLSVDISDKVDSFSITKSASDLGISGMPVGQLLASTGSLKLFDYDQAFLQSNTNSIISEFTAQSTKFSLYELVVDVNGVDYQIPIKTMYSEGFPEIDSTSRSVSIELRDMFFYFESLTAPQLLLQDVSLSFAVSTLLDYVGFSNYSFKRVPDEDELIIPFFFVAPDKSIAEVLNDLAISAQAAMFFDEYNNFIVMSKGYMLPDLGARDVDVDATLIGSNTRIENGEIKNSKTRAEQPNIVELSSQTNNVYNDGLISYSTRYIQKSYSSIKQASMVDRDQTWVYKPALLWEVTGSQNTKPKNEEQGNQSDYVLSAIPLNSDLSDKLPSVVDHKLKNNVIDFGEGVYWLSRYNGYFFANGEIIKYDAVQFSIAGPVPTKDLGINWVVEDGNTIWITSVQEYQRYFAQLPFNGKMYPTGLVRIYSQPEYEDILDANGDIVATRLKNTSVVKKHGRTQFGTGKLDSSGSLVPIYHNAGLSKEWSGDDRVRGCDMDVKYLFGSAANKEIVGPYSDSIVRGTAVIKNQDFTDIPALITGGTGTDTNFKSVAHGLLDNDVIYLRTSGTLPTGVTAAKIYYVNYVDEDNFEISNTPSGASLQLSDSSLAAQNGNALVYPMIANGSLSVTIGISEDSESDANFSTAADHGLVVGQPVSFSSVGSISGISAGITYIVKTVTDSKNFKLKTVSGGQVITSGTAAAYTMNVFSYPARVLCANHRFLPGDPIKFTTTGSLPSGILANTTYYVQDTGFESAAFLISTTKTGQKVKVGGTQSGEHTLMVDYLKTPVGYSGTALDWEKSRIVIPDATIVSAGLVVEKLSGTGTFKDNTVIASVDVDHNVITLNKPVTSKLVLNTTDPATGAVVINVIRAYEQLLTVDGIAGMDIPRAKTTTRNGIIKNFMSNVFLEESVVNRSLATQSGTIQSSALVMNGSSYNNEDQTPSFISYVYKPLTDKFVHFGTRMRIIGKIDSNEQRGQSPFGVSTYYTASSKTSDKPTTIAGASGGVAVMVNPETNSGYYFEIAALTASNLANYPASDNIHNVLFYKVRRNATAPNTAAGNKQKAIPLKLYGGVANILVDNGLLTGQYRQTSEENPTVYDLAVEYKKVGNALKFFLYINNVLVATVLDDDPLEIYNNMALFVRGSSRVMFENVYALGNNYSQNTVFALDTVANSAFGDLEINANNSFQKYALSGIIQSTYLSGIGPSEAPKYKLFYDEFGTIMREAAYFNVRYDKAYPSLYAKMAPTFNKLKGYTVSGFVAGAYKAEFMVFNNTDSALSLDASSGNYLRILGITFTQQSQHELTVDEFYSKRSDMSNQDFSGDNLVTSPNKELKLFNDIKFSRMTHGRKQFSIDAPYIQNADSASGMMSWLTTKIMKPRKSVGVKVFGMPTIQLGDIVNIDYTNNDGVEEVGASSTRFVVYSIEHSRSAEDVSMVLYLSEVG